MVRFETETHPCRGHGELEEPSLGGDGKESGKEQTEEGSERLSPNKGLPRLQSVWPHKLGLKQAELPSQYHADWQWQKGVL